MNSQGTGPASRAESVTVNAAGLVQDIVLVTFPAASTIFTAPSSYGLSGSHGHRAGAGAVVAVVLGGLSLVIAHRRPSPATAHPRPAQPRTRLSPVVASGEAPA